MTITLPDTMRIQVETNARAAGFATIDEYVVSLVLEAEVPPPTVGNRPVQSKEELEDILIASLESGTPRVADTDFWEERARRQEEYAAQKGASS